MRLIWLLHVITFFFFFTFGLTIPVLPVYLTTQFEVSLEWVGWVVGLMPLAGILLRPWTGWLSDGWSRKWPSIIGLTVSGLAGLFYFGNFPLLIVGRLLQGVGIALFAPATLALTSDIAPPDKLTGIMSTRNLIVGVGVMVGSAAGGWLDEAFGIWLVFLLIAAAQLIFVPLLLAVPETLRVKNPESWWRGYAAVVKIKSILAASVGNMGFAAVFSALQAFYPIILSQSGFSLALVGTFFGFYSLISVIFRIPAGYLADRVGAERVALWGFGISFLGIVTLSLLPLPPFSFIAAVLMGIGAGFYLPSNLVTVSQSAPKVVRGSAFSLFTLSWDLGGVVGPGIGSFIAALWGPQAVIPCGGLLAIVIVLTYARMSGTFIVRRVRPVA
jgi:MFS family permease